MVEIKTRREQKDGRRWDIYMKILACGVAENLFAAIPYEIFTAWSSSWHLGRVHCSLLPAAAFHLQAEPNRSNRQHAENDAFCGDFITISLQVVL